MKRERLVALGALLILALLVGLALELKPTATQSTISEASFQSSSSSREMSSSVQQQSSKSGTIAVVESTTISVPNTSASTLDRLTSLRLNLNLSVDSNGRVVVTVYESNTLNQVSNVTDGQSWPNATLFRWEENNCDSEPMAGYEMLEGNYGQNNFTDGTALWLQPQVLGLQCGSGGPPEPFTFRPLGDENVVTGTYAGFWSGPGADSKFSPFPPGIYTVLAGDAWGSVAILHFTVRDQA